MAVSYVTLYLPGSSQGMQVVEGSQLHRIYVAMGANSVAAPSGETVRQDPYPQYVDAEELAAALAGLGGVGGGAVDSVNGQTGAVVLDAADIADSPTRKLMTSDERDKLADISPGANVYTDAQALTAVRQAATVTPTGAWDFAQTPTVGGVPVGSGGGGGSQGVDFGAVSLDSFAGATDDEKLATAMSAIASDTYPRKIQLTNRRYDFTVGNRVAYHGFRIGGPMGYNVPEQNQQSKMPCRVHLSMTGPWLINSGTVFGATISDISFTGGSQATVIASAGSADWRCLQMTNIGACNVKGVAGTIDNPMRLTASVFNGVWDVSGFYNTPFHLAGSDNVLWPDGMILTGAPNYLIDGNSVGAYQLWLDWMAKSYIGPLYITAENAWGGIYVSGGGQVGPNTFIGMRVEGRNVSAPGYGALFRQQSGISIIRDSWFAYAMSNPSGMSGHNPADAGIIHHEGGKILVSGCTYARATGVAESVPFVYTSSTGACMVNNIMPELTWSGLPRVVKASGTAENRITDATVTLV